MIIFVIALSAAVLGPFFGMSYRGIAQEVDRQTIDKATEIIRNNNLN